MQTIIRGNTLFSTSIKGGGVSTIGYAAEEIESAGVVKKFFGKKITMGNLDAVIRSAALVRRAVAGRLTIPCDFSTAEKALIDNRSRASKEVEREWDSEVKGACRRYEKRNESEGWGLSAGKKAIRIVGRSVFRRIGCPTDKRVTGDW